MIKRFFYNISEDNYRQPKVYPFLLQNSNKAKNTFSINYSATLFFLVQINQMTFYRVSKHIIYIIFL